MSTIDTNGIVNSAYHGVVVGIITIMYSTAAREQKMAVVQVRFLCLSVAISLCAVRMIACSCTFVKVRQGSLNIIVPVGHCLVYSHGFLSFNGLDLVYSCRIYDGYDLNTSVSHVKRHQTQGNNGFRYVLFFCILVCGDVELNPGPVYKYPCGTREKPVK